MVAWCPVVFREYLRLYLQLYSDRLGKAVSLSQSYAGELVKKILRELPHICTSNRVRFPSSESHQRGSKLVWFTARCKESTDWLLDHGVAHHRS